MGRIRRLNLRAVKIGDVWFGIKRSQAGSFDYSYYLTIGKANQDPIVTPISFESEGKADDFLRLLAKAEIS